MNIDAYVWKDGQAVGVVVPDNWDDLIKEGISDQLVVDLTKSLPKNRYGKWVAAGMTWEPIPFETFPPEFHLQLLLLGVS